MIRDAGSKSGRWLFNFVHWGYELTEKDFFNELSS